MIGYLLSDGICVVMAVTPPEFLLSLHLFTMQEISRNQEISKASIGQPGLYLEQITVFYQVIKLFYGMITTKVVTTTIRQLLYCSGDRRGNFSANG